MFTIETEVSQCKTGRAKDRRSLSLPVRAKQAVGMCGTSWATAFLDARKEMGIVASPVLPFMPYIQDGRPTGC
eukprot:1186355-Amphidinium_carterae.2